MNSYKTNYRFYKQTRGTSLIDNMVKTIHTDDTILYRSLEKPAVLELVITPTLQNSATEPNSETLTKSGFLNLELLLPLIP